MKVPVQKSQGTIFTTQIQLQKCHLKSFLVVYWVSFSVSFWMGLWVTISESNWISSPDAFHFSYHWYLLTRSLPVVFFASVTWKVHFLPLKSFLFDYASDENSLQGQSNQCKKKNSVRSFLRYIFERDSKWKAETQHVRPQKRNCCYTNWLSRK